MIQIAPNGDFKHITPIGSSLDKPSVFVGHPDEHGNIRLAFRSTPEHGVTALRLASMFSGGGNEHAAGGTANVVNYMEKFIALS